MNNYPEQPRQMHQRASHFTGTTLSITHIALLAFIAIVTMFPLTVVAQRTSLKLPDGFVNETYAEFDFAAVVKGEGNAEWSVVPNDDGQKPLPDGLTLSSAGKLTGKPTKAGLYRFQIKAGDLFTSTVWLRILPAGFDEGGLNGAELLASTLPANLALPACKPPESTFVLASSTADEETIALTEDAGEETLKALDLTTLEIEYPDRLIASTLGNGVKNQRSLFRKGDYVIIDIVKWKAIKEVNQKTDKENRKWALFEFTDLPKANGGGLGWVARMNPDEPEIFDTRIFGSRRVAVLMLHIQTPRTWDVKYKVDINLRIPKPIENAIQLGRFLGGAGLTGECEPPLTRNIWGGRLMLVRYQASDVIVKLNTVTGGGSGEPVSQSKDDEKQYLNEGRYHWDVSVGMPVKAFKELEFSSEDGIVTAKKVDRQNAYGFLNLYPQAVDLHGKSYFTTLHAVLGVPISGKPLDRPLIGLGTGFYTKLFKMNFFAGVSFNKIREPRTLAEGEAATESQLQSDIQTRRVKKFVFGINFPIKQFIDAVKGSN